MVLMDKIRIWKPVVFDEKWNDVDTVNFDNIRSSWDKRRTELQDNTEQYERFMDQLKRKQAIDTGIIERMYDLKRGITETFITEGFVDSYLQHGDTNIEQNRLMEYLGDNFEAIDFVFDFVKENRLLTKSYIKELHSLITRHQEMTDAVDQFGNTVSVPLKKGVFKTSPNNPRRGNTVFEYCPPEQVESEIDRLLEIYNTSLNDIHTIVKAAFLHHSFSQIHPFQDGNGRIARLLASFVLIKGGLFPLSIEREDRARYIDALEKADDKNYQELINLFSENQIMSIKRALNWRLVDDSSNYEAVVNMFESKLVSYRKTVREHKDKLISDNMRAIFAIVETELKQYKNNLDNKLDINTEISLQFCAPGEQNAYYYTHQITEYANQFGYYVNLSLEKCWGRMFISIDESKMYRFVVSVHHYGYDNSTFAIGGTLSKVISDQKDEDKRDYLDILLKIPPLTISSEKKIDDMESSIRQQIKSLIISALAYIVNEL